MAGKTFRKIFQHFPDISPKLPKISEIFFRTPKVLDIKKMG